MAALKPWEVNAAALLLESAASGHNVAVGIKNEGEKGPSAWVFNWHHPPGPAPARQPSRGSVWAARRGLRVMEPFTASD